MREMERQETDAFEALLAEELRAQGRVEPRAELEGRVLAAVAAAVVAEASGTPWRRVWVWTGWIGGLAAAATLAVGMHFNDVAVPGEGAGNVARSTPIVRKTSGGVSGREVRTKGATDGVWRQQRRVGRVRSDPRRSSAVEAGVEERLTTFPAITQRGVPVHGSGGSGNHVHMDDLGQVTQEAAMAYQELQDKQEQRIVVARIEIAPLPNN